MSLISEDDVFEEAPAPSDTRKRVRRLTWDDALVMGALTFGVEMYNVKTPQQKSEIQKQVEKEREEKRQRKVAAQRESNDTNERYSSKPPPRSEQEKQNLRKAFDQKMEQLRKEKDLKDEKRAGGNRPMVDGGGQPYESFKDLGNRPGYLVNAMDPDMLPMEARRYRGGNARKRKEEGGAVPSAWQRYLIDGKIFNGSVVKGRGGKSRGSVLVDLSGSMSWNVDEIAMMLDYLPEGTAYGYGGGGVGQLQGRWLVLADRGRAVPAELVQNWRTYAGYDNLVDLPCLAMLANMPKPRFWISDGEATGIHGYEHSIVKACKKFCQEHDIVRIPHAKQLKQFMTRGSF